ncbi:uncharacterized protein LOC126368316 [Pectinophora gossypiella]|uniref:uncharacterized protein LOC126368316 n=1 Tax=Pectinophora gossypiella TaxID=13191 RepID=UPI00214EB33A|nr:uncharacterized protein LOC126368316 [Pectinophora gossypiella]
MFMMTPQPKMETQSSSTTTTQLTTTVSSTWGIQEADTDVDYNDPEQFPRAGEELRTTFLRTTVTTTSATYDEYGTDRNMFLMFSRNSWTRTKKDSLMIVAAMTFGSYFGAKYVAKVHDIDYYDIILNFFNRKNGTSTTAKPNTTMAPDYTGDYSDSDSDYRRR